MVLVLKRMNQWGCLVETRVVFRAARKRFAIESLEPSQIYGRRPEFAVKVEIRPHSGGTIGHGIWVFRMAEDGAITHLSNLWNPLAYIKGNPGLDFG